MSLSEANVISVRKYVILIVHQNHTNEKIKRTISHVVLFIKFKLIINPAQ